MSDNESDLRVMNQSESQDDVVSIVIPTRNSAEPLSRLLASIQHQSHSVVETIVADGSSTDTTVRVAESLGAIVVREAGHMAEARNRGARIAKGRYFLFLDADMELDRTVISQCLEHIQDCDALSIRELVPPANYWARCRGLEKLSFYHSGTFEAARFFRREAFESLHGYDAKLINSVEDVEFQLRFLGGGYRLGWVEGPIIHHEENLGLVDYLSKRRGRGFSEYVSNHPAAWRQFRSPIIRLKLILEYLKKSGHFRDAMLVPGLITLRGMEYVLRA